MKPRNETFEKIKLEKFEGPLDFLIYLIQKNELDIYDIPLQEITTQFLEKLTEYTTPGIDAGAEFIGTTAWLLHLKSKALLPKHEIESLSEEDDDPQFEIIHKIIDYCRFKRSAKELAELEVKQGSLYPRPYNEVPEVKKTLGIEHLTINDLETLFHEMLVNASSRRGIIEEDTWRVSDKIQSIRCSLRKKEKMTFTQLFSCDSSKGEVIVTFLAILELMKLGEAMVIRETTSKEVMLIPNDNKDEEDGC